MLMVLMQYIENTYRVLYFGFNFYSYSEVGVLI